MSVGAIPDGGTKLAYNLTAVLGARITAVEMQLVRCTLLVWRQSFLSKSVLEWWNCVQCGGALVCLLCDVLKRAVIA